MMEHAVLGSFLIESSISDKADFIFDELSETDFNRDSSRRMFRVFKEMHENEESIDLVTVCAKLKAKGELETIGGEVFVCSLMDSVSTTNHIRHYAGKVRKNAVMRKIRREISQLNPEAEPEAVERVMQLVQERDTDDGVSVVTPKAFMLYCSAYSNWKRANDALKKTKQIYRTPNGAVQQSPFVSIARGWMQMMTKLAAEMGIPATMRSRIMPQTGNSKDEDTEFFGY